MQNSVPLETVERILTALKKEPSRSYWLSRVPSYICEELGFPKEAQTILKEALARGMGHFLRICTQAQEETEALQLSRGEAAYQEHRRVQELVGQNMPLLARATQELFDEKQLRIATAMVRRRWTPLGALPDSVLLEEEG